MAKTILNLSLNYRGKHLDTIRQGTDFVNKWQIGTDKHLFWQILDDTQKFPSKHKLLVKRGNDFHLQLPDGSHLSCSKDGNPLDANFLKQNGILSGSLLKLRNDLSGTVQINPDYEIQFGYSEPRKTVLRPEEQAVVNSSLQPATPSASERTETGLILLFLILGLAFVLIYDLVIKPRMDKEKTLTETLAELERVRRIEPQLGLTAPQATTPDTPPEEPKAGDTAEQKKPGGKQPAKPTTRTTGTTGARQDQGVPDKGQIFGTNRPGDTSGTSRPQTAYAVTGLQDFVTARPGARGSATGTRPGPGTFDPKASSGFTGSFDPKATSGFNASASDVGRVATTQPGGPGSTTRPNLPTQTFTGDASKLQTPPPASGPPCHRPGRKLRGLPSLWSKPRYQQDTHSGSEDPQTRFLRSGRRCHLQPDRRPQRPDRAILQKERCHQEANRLHHSADGHSGERQRVGPRNFEQRHLHSKFPE